MKLVVETPPAYPEERQYVISVVFGDFLKLDCDIRRTERHDVRISAADGRELLVDDSFFQTPESDWMTQASLPPRPLCYWNASAAFADLPTAFTKVPVIYGTPLSGDAYCDVHEEFIRIGLDIFGSIFFMLSRYEEVVGTERDSHGRFPATASLAYQEGLLERPIANEYLEILWACLKRVWPGIERGVRHYQVVLSHDVDSPLSVIDKSWPGVLTSAGSDLLRRWDVPLAARRLRARLASYRGNYDADPCNTFDLIMETSERVGLRDAFYFIVDNSAGPIDGDYSIDMPWMRNLMRRIAARGHEVGLHPSYNTYRDVARTKREFSKLLKVAEEEGIRQSQWGGRQHYLRWDAGCTWRNWSDAGLTYDSTLSFADHVGFRCGICYEFSVFDLTTRKKLPLRERPLVAMDASLLAEVYMHLSAPAAVGRIHDLAATCKAYGGQFTLLWHNSTLVSRNQKHLYRQALEGIV